MTKQHDTDQLLTAFDDVIWMAIRYANGRHTYTPNMVRNAIALVREIYPDWELRYDPVGKEDVNRAREDLNNHDFRTLRDSEVWQAYCGEDAYGKIGEFTGFDLRGWISQNIAWEEDLLPETISHFTENNLMGYLEW